MAKNEVYRVGQYVPAPVPALLTGTPLAQAQAKGLSSTPAGSPGRVGSLNFVTVTERNDTEKQFGGHLGEASVDLGGAHGLPVVVAGAALTWGQPIYLIVSSQTLTTVVGSNPLFGYALEYNVPVNAAAQIVTVKIAN